MNLRPVLSLIREMRLGRPYVPLDLVLCLGAGCATLLALLTVVPGQYRNAQPVVAGGEAGKAPKPDERDSAHPIATRSLGLEKDGDARPPEDDARYGLIRDRVAVNIWARSGYLRDAEWQLIESNPPQIVYRVTLSSEPQSCAAGEPLPGVKYESSLGAPLEPASTDDDRQPAVTLSQEKQEETDRIARRHRLAEKLAIAAVAVEKFHRNRFQRWLELAYATRVLKLRGHLADLSLGIAQIRPSTVRRLAPVLPPIPDMQLARILAAR